MKKRIDKKTEKKIESVDEMRSNSLTEILAIFYVTVVLIALFLKILFG